MGAKGSGSARRLRERKRDFTRVSTGECKADERKRGFNGERVVGRMSRGGKGRREMSRGEGELQLQWQSARWGAVAAAGNSRWAIQEQAVCQGEAHGR